MKHGLGIFCTVVCAVSLSACAKKPSEIAPSYVSPVAYTALSCKELSAEAARVSSRAASATGAQEDKANKDSVLVGVSLVLFWPAAFFVGDDASTSTEVAKLKGEMEAIETASAQNNCGIVFSRG